MKNYTLYTYRVTRKGRELIEIKEFPRPRFTNKDWKDILVPTLYFLAATSNAYKNLDAVLFCDGVKVLTVRCSTRTDGSTITAYMDAARPREVFRPLRAMTIAC